MACREDEFDAANRTQKLLFRTKWQQYKGYISEIIYFCLGTHSAVFICSFYYDRVVVSDKVSVLTN